MQTMDASLSSLVRAGKITMKMAESRSSNPLEVRRLVESGGGYAGENHSESAAAAAGAAV
jgi:hypothetical protein